MVTDKFPERRKSDKEPSSLGQFEKNAARIEVIEAKQAEHLEILMQNTVMTRDIHERFNTLESGIKGNEQALAKALDEWKTFSIVKFDESSARQIFIESRQSEHMDILSSNTVALANLKSGIDSVLTIVTVADNAKKTTIWAGKIVLWVGGVSAAWLAILSASKTHIKDFWP